MSDHKMKNLKTSSSDRRLSIAKASLFAGTRWATAQASSLFASPEEKERLRKKALEEQVQYLVTEIGKLKGSIVKVGQMLALYGEHFLPEEVTTALSQLNNQTVGLEWSVIQQQLRQQLGNKLDELEVNPEPLGTASLAQVHRAKRKSDGTELVLKVQYPAVATAIDSDMALLKNLLRLTRLAPQTREFDQWFEEVRLMMHREVNYRLEAESTQRFAERLKDDARYIVPQIYPEYCTHSILCMSYEQGISVNHPELLTLSQQRRNQLGEHALNLMIQEIFQWGEMQTDPNFGNYLVRLAEDEHGIDQIILLDFGAIRQFDAHLLKIARGLIRAGYHHDHVAMMNAMTGYRFFDQLIVQNKRDMAKLFLIACEAFSEAQLVKDCPQGTFDDTGAYDWCVSQLHQRLLQHSQQSVTSRHFTVPPKEFMFISRKFIGAYTFMTVIQAKTHLRPLIEPYLSAS